MGGQRHAPAALPPGERPGTHCICGWVGTTAGLDGCGKSRPPPGIDPRSAQPVTSRYTDWAIPAQALGNTINNLENSMLHLNLKPETSEGKSTMLQPKCPAQCNTWDWCGPSFMYLLSVTCWPRTFRIIPRGKLHRGKEMLVSVWYI